MNKLTYLVIHNKECLNLIHPRAGHRGMKLWEGRPRRECVRLRGAGIRAGAALPQGAVPPHMNSLPYSHQRMANPAIITPIAPEDTVMSLNVSLPPELEARVRQKVESGLYGSASEVIREALRLFETYENARTATLTALRLDIAQGLADIEAGKVIEADPEKIKAHGRQLLLQRKTLK